MMKQRKIPSITVGNFSESLYDIYWKRHANSFHWIVRQLLVGVWNQSSLMDISCGTENNRPDNCTNSTNNVFWNKEQWTKDNHKKCDCQRTHDLVCRHQEAIWQEVSWLTVLSVSQHCQGVHNDVHITGNSSYDGKYGCQTVSQTDQWRNQDQCCREDNCPGRNTIVGNFSKRFSHPAVFRNFCCQLIEMSAGWEDTTV